MNWRANPRDAAHTTQTEFDFVIIKTEIVPLAKVAELVDAHDSKSCIFGCVGSIPTFGTADNPKMKSLSRALGLFTLELLVQVNLNEAPHY